MEKEHLIIIAILGVILYMCMNKSEGFNYQQGGIGDYKPQHIRYQMGGPCGDGGCTQRIRYENEEPPKTLTNNPNARLRSSMNIMGSQHVRNHIRSDRRNNMMNSMMYGYQPTCDPNVNPQDCGPTA